VKAENGERHFGEKLRLVRERKKLTMREVAERAGVSESMVSQIERNKVSPALDTLLSLVDVLGIDIEYLFADYKKERLVNLVRLEDRQRIVTKSAVYERLSSIVEPDDAHGIEAYYLEIAPGGERGSAEYGHIGKELGLIVRGKADFTIGSKTYSLNEGDSISFRSDSPHLLKNVGEGPLKAFWINTPPKKEI
jgi:transcriptional regulator with XRE-family HTH domain